MRSRKNTWSKGHVTSYVGGSHDKSPPCQIWFGHCISGDTMFLVLEEQDSIRHYCLSLKHIIAYTKFYNKKNAGKNIYQDLQWRKPDPGHTLFGWRMMKHWQKKFLPVHYWNKNERMKKKTATTLAIAKRLT